MFEFMHALRHHDCRMVGFNNFYYDYQLLHHCLTIGPEFTAAQAYEKSFALINTPREAKFKDVVWGKEHFVKQIDLYLIHHFDNFAKSTSLKEIEFNNRSRNIGDLAVDWNAPLPYELRRPALTYCCHDVDETDKFAEDSAQMIAFREELVPTMGYDVMSYNDTKIGKKYFEQELRKKAPHLLGTYGNKRQTPRQSIRIADVILPYIEYETDQLQAMLQHLKSTVITQTKAPPELKDLSVTLEGFTMHVGAGGGHGSVERQKVQPPEGWDLIDVDVASYYPSLAIKNRFYPEHLSETFCDIYEDVYNQRKQHAKKTAPNEMLKLALNGVYGDSANPHSIFLNPQYTMQITINGQLLLYLLTEKILCHTNSKMVQLNTDGITFMVPKTERHMAMQICEWWEKLTGLTLEYADYSRMWIRDVNSYMAETTEGKLKRIGAYSHETQRENPATREIKWCKDHSALIVPKAAEAFMVHGTPVDEFVRGHADAFDFMLRAKATGKSRLRLMHSGDEDTSIAVKGEFVADAGQRLQKLTRYVIANQGGALQKVMPPLPKKPGIERIIGINVGHKVQVFDDLADFDPRNINFQWYIDQAKDLTIS